MNLLLSVGLAFAQTETKAVESTTADVSVKNGIQFEHKPSNFKMKMNAFVQGRATYEDWDDANAAKVDATDLNIRRMRLSMSGTVADPQFFYKLQMGFAKDDLDFTNSGTPNVLVDAVAGWKFNDNHSVFFGQAKLPSNRQRTISGSSLELVDRSILNSNFTLDRDIGLQSAHKFWDDRPVWVRLALSNGDGRGVTNTGTGMAYTGRLEWLPLGAFTGDNDFTEGDLVREATPKVALGAAYGMNQRTRRLGGQLGKLMNASTTRDMKSFFGDIVVKYQGWALSGEYANRKSDNPFVAAVVTPAAAAQTILVGQAYTAQLSYVLESMWSPVLRYTFVEPEEQIYAAADDVTQYTVGVSKYFDGHRVKLQADVTSEKLENPVTAKDETNTFVRMQFQMGF